MFVDSILDQLQRFVGQGKKAAKVKAAWKTLFEFVIAEMKEAYLQELEQAMTQ